MIFSLTVGPNNEHRIEYSRNWFTGEERLVADGEVVAMVDATSLSTHFNLDLRRRHEFTLKGSPPLAAVFEKERPLFFGGLRRQTYRVFVGGALVLEKKGF